MKRQRVIAGRPAWRGAPGFTLLELLLVMFMVALMAGLAGLSLRGQDDSLELAGQRLFGLAQLASEEAVLRNRQMGLGVYRSTEAAERFAYLWMYWDGRAWLAINEPPYERADIPDGLSLVVELDGLPVELPGSEFGASRAAPQLLFLSSGETNRFEIELRQEDSGAALRIVADGVGGLELLEEGEDGA